MIHLALLAALAASPAAAVPSGHTGTLAPFCAAAPGSGIEADPEVPDAALRGFAKAIGRYLAGAGQSADASQERQALREAAGKIEDKYGLESILAHPTLLARAWDQAAAPTARRLKKGKITEEEVVRRGFEAAPLSYAVRIPKKYSARDREHPLIVLLTPPRAIVPKSLAAFLEAPLDASDAEEVAAFRDRAVVICPSLPDDRSARTQVTADGQPGGIQITLATLDESIARYGIDRNRVCLVGIGEGAELALACVEHAPQRFAGVAIFPGEEDPLTIPKDAANLRTVGLYVSGRNLDAEDLLKDGEARGHGRQWNRMSWPDGGPWSFLAAQVREVLPNKVTVRPGLSFPTRVHWMAVDSVSRDSEATATLDREAGRIVIDCKGCGAIRLLLNDDMLPLERTLEVVINGTTQRVPAYRDWITALDAMSDGRATPSWVPTCELRVRVPSAPKKPAK